MDPERVMNLFDSIWFESKIFTKNPKNPISETKNPVKIDTQPEISKLPTIHVRSKSDQFSSITSFSDSLSPNSVLFSPRLKTIFSGKEAKSEETEHKVERLKSRRRTKGSTKSLSDLEFEELKGFMDLGFVFSEEDVNSSLVEIIPGLQRLGKKEEGGDDVAVVERPYLSEAWKMEDMIINNNNNNNPLTNWKIPDLGSEIDVKNSLKWWAHSVASAVR